MIKEQFFNYFSGEPILIRAPGRINLIGEHTDYNEGFVFPASVGQEIQFAVSKSGDDDCCSIVSLDFQEKYDFRISELASLKGDHWQNYILGVVAEIIKPGRDLKGFNMVFSGNIPQGSGMSSSAALECGTSYALNALFALEIPKLEMIRIAQLAEHNYAGVMCGIMDQFACMMGKKDQALRLDCRSLEYSYFPLQLSDYSMVLCNSNVTHNLASSKYNERRHQCEEAVSLLQKSYSEIKSLRDVSISELELVKTEMPYLIYQRAKYVVEENIRVHSFAKALEKGNYQKIAEILQKAQYGMRYEYEVTCPEIDFMADFANKSKNVAGSRMMGGGFGGCTLNFVKKGIEKTFIDDLNSKYAETFNNEITSIEIDIQDGVSFLENREH